MDRRTIWAILFMMVIAIAPAIFIKRPPKSAVPPVPQADTSTRVPQTDTTTRVPSAQRSDSATPTVSPGPAAPAGAVRAADTVRVVSPLYTYGISTRGGRLLDATLHRYRSMAPGQRGSTAQILPPDSRLLDLTLV